MTDQTFPNLIQEPNVQVRLDDLAEHPRNWRRHSAEQKAAARAALEEGTAANILVNRRTGRIINGHLRYELARDLGHSTVSVDYIDVDEDLEERLLVRIDSLPLMADVDTLALAELVDSLSPSEDILRGAVIELLEVEDLTQAMGGVEPQQRLEYLDDDESNDAGGCKHEWVCTKCGATRS